MKKRIEVTSVAEAWNMVNALFPTDYTIDESSTERAGYPVYRSNTEHYNYICDLNDRLEINLKEGNKTINVWIVEPVEPEPELPTLPVKEEIQNVAAHQYLFEPEQAQIITILVSSSEYGSSSDQAVYTEMKAADDFWKNHIAGDLAVAYCNNKGIEWGTIRVINIAHYDHGNRKNSGHYIIEAVVFPRVKE